MKELLAVLALSACALATPKTAHAHDGEDYLGSVFLFANAGSEWGFCPRGSMLADGSLLPISQYSALFSILGTSYGGDGRTTFGLPDFRNVAPMSANGAKMGYCVVVNGIFPSRS